MNRVNKDTARNVLIISMVFIFFFGLAYMFPYTIGLGEAASVSNASTISLRTITADIWAICLLSY